LLEPGHLQSISVFSDSVSAWSHLGGALAFGGLGVALVSRGRGESLRMLSLFVFATSCVLLLSVSGAYHLQPPAGADREFLRRLDHAAIFVLIAGTFTPVHAILFRGAWRWGVLVGVWAFALCGIVFKTLYFADIPESIGLFLYLAFGWFGLASSIALARRFGFRVVRLALSGAMAYTLGALVDFLRWPDPLPGIVGPHELFHLAVLAGISFHWRFIYGVAARERAPPVGVGPFGLTAGGLQP
jgi:channel protein (hemolysin III family)